MARQKTRFLRALSALAPRPPWLARKLCFLRALSAPPRLRVNSFLLLLLLPSLATAQNGSPVEGQLLNSVTHAGIPAIKVSVSSVRVQLLYETHTDSEGRFHFPLVAPGDYSIQFEARDFLPLSISDPASQMFHVADMTSPVTFVLSLIHI